MRERVEEVAEREVVERERVAMATTLSKEETEESMMEAAAEVSTAEKEMDPTVAGVSSSAWTWTWRTHSRVVGSIRDSACEAEERG